jgi:uroporphyrinogen III methyltransferase / synthase
MEQEQQSKEIKSGKVYLVGAGPGDPSLITLRGAALLEKAEVVVYDYLASQKLLRYVPRKAEYIYAGKKGGGVHTHSQEEINQILVDRALQGKIVVRLKGGDPFIFGRGGEELQELVKAGVDFEAVPGVTSASAAATYAGVPITHRGYTSSVAFITGHEDPTKEDSNLAWDKISTGIGTLVFYMGIKNLDSITKNLMENGRDPKTPVAVVRWASSSKQQSLVGTLDTIAGKVKEEKLKPPAIVVVGDVVGLRDKLNWFEKKPLLGNRILVTRTREQASELIARLEENGADCLERATISIDAPESWDQLDRELERISNYNWLLFTSVNAIKYFFIRFFENKLDARKLHGIKIGAVGTVTADMLKNYGLSADFIPKTFTGEGMGRQLAAKGIKGDNFLIPRANKARESLPDILSKAGGLVTTVPVYRNMRPKGQEENMRMEIEGGSVNWVTFTSSSTVSNFVKTVNAKSPEELKKLMEGVKIAAIGPVTAETVKSNGLTVDCMPETYTINAMVEAIIDQSK